MVNDKDIRGPNIFLYILRGVLSIRGRHYWQLFI